VTRAKAAARRAATPYDLGMTVNSTNNERFDFGDDLDDQLDAQIEEYSLNSAPNDFNLLTIVSFIESGAIKIPGFQRNYVWDQKRASKLIESLIVGLPIPQIFLYEAGKNEFLVIDGQQRLLTIYFFFKQRFPKKSLRAELRKVFAEHGSIPNEVLEDDNFFSDFHLQLGKVSADKQNKFNGLSYGTLEDLKRSFDLRTIRSVIIKQQLPSDDDSSIYEMFNRLNTGGVNLSPQEIRSSLFHSRFFDLLFEMNLDPRWRLIVGDPQPDLHMRDIEVLLRALAMSEMGTSYRPSMTSFLNKYSKSAKSLDDQALEEVRSRLNYFFDVAKSTRSENFSSQNGKFMVTLFESVFASVMAAGLRPDVELDGQEIVRLRDDERFKTFTSARSTDTANVQARLVLTSEFSLLRDANE
jgi:hypothetical protein